MTRKEHLTWCKDQAKVSLNQNISVQTVWADFVANMRKHAETQNHPNLLGTGRMVTKGLVLYKETLIEHLDTFI